jgi:hypothetical protein
MRAIAIGLLLAVPAAWGANEEGQREEKRACTACHGLRIVHVQRLARATWECELEKMERWGTVIRNRAALLDYLVENFGEKVPPAPAVMSGDGRKSSAK